MKIITAHEPSCRAQLASDIVLVNGWGFLYGVGPIDLENDRTPLAEGVEKQTASIFRNLDHLLRSAGLARANVVAVRVHLVEYARLYERMNSAYQGFFQSSRLPARSCIGVSHLTRGAQVEMDFVLCSDIAQEDRP